MFVAHATRRTSGFGTHETAQAGLLVFLVEGKHTKHPGSHRCEKARVRVRNYQHSFRRQKTVDELPPIFSHRVSGDRKHWLWVSHFPHSSRVDSAPHVLQNGTAVSRSRSRIEHEYGPRRHIRTTVPTVERGLIRKDHCTFLSPPFLAGSETESLLEITRNGRCCGACV